MKNRKDIAVMVVLLASVVVLTVLTLGGSGREGGAFEMYPRRTSYSTRPNGTKALFVTLEELGYAVSRHHTSFERLPKTAQLLFVISPLQPITRKEWQAAKRWVALGGHVCLGLEDQLVPGWAEGAFDEEGDDPFHPHPATPAATTQLSFGVKEIQFKGLNRLGAGSYEARPSPEPKAEEDSSDDRSQTPPDDACEPGVP